jgi:hypothetical protein
MTTYFVVYGTISLVVGIIAILDLLERRQERRRGHKPHA